MKSLLLLLVSVCTAVGAVQNSTVIESRQSSDKLVFAHFMIGIVANRGSPRDYDSDMQRAKAIGIDAFALNIGTDPYTDQQLDLAYQSAADNGLKVFISFDFNWYHDNSDGTRVGQKIAQYANRPAQLRVDNKVFASSFAGDALDVNAMRNAVGQAVFFVPNFHVGQANFNNLDGAFNWMGWQSNGNNKAPQPGRTVTVQQGDNDYIRALGSKPYMAPVSPWFFTHFGPEVPYSKNWVFPGDLLWYNRWKDLLNVKPRFIEIVTWNDYGESHYIGPLSSPHNDDGGSKWVNDMPHGGWLDMAIPFIKAYKAGATDVTPYITNEQIIYWYRPTPKNLNCDSTDTTMVGANNASGNYFQGRPNGWETMNDRVFVVPLLKQAGTVTVNSGGTIYNFNAPAGASAFAVDFALGSQSFTLTRNGQTVLSATSLKQITNTCPCGLYNFNPYVGTVPAGARDTLQPNGLQMFTNGLKVSCQASPSLPVNPPASANPTATKTPIPAPTTPV
ncbi:glycoside hydrolase family 71 protein [Botryobasidium botryosum FD-172 SS1]|uniref:Glycoside hydrolase family 71 protein n=1 Tax=Botryobasidium botryosum (strain FD-172 SS1) TaxID=930990 RepID=A0A067M4J8_BOTB1|nr:glycoside hydrolase family 71 protein [Botryobasidium botryosum FD-172 SS1]